MTQKPDKITIVFNLSATDNPVRAAEESYKLHCRVLKDLPLRPVVIWQKEPSDFAPERCLTAFSGDRVVGCALLVPYPSANDLYDKIAAKLGPDAAQKTRDACRDFNRAAPIYEIGAICVDPAFRGQGIARRFYELAARQTGGNVYAVIAKPNDASRQAALKAGYAVSPDSVHRVGYDVRGGRIYPSLAGREEVIAEIYRPPAPVKG